MIRTVSLLLLLTVSSVWAGETPSIAPGSESPPAVTADPTWAERVDEFWGPGVSTAEKLAFFDTFWTTIDRDFACFQDLDVDWNALRDLYRPEVAAGVSKGRFAAIMSRLSLALMDAHTVALDRDVFWRTPNEPGVPLLVVGQWGQINDFGACLTPLPNGSAMVYRAVEDHPMGLVPGMVIVRVDGREWSDLYDELLGEGLPVTGFWASSDEGFEHSWQMAVGANWHLIEFFEAIVPGDDVQYLLSTAPLEGWYTDLWCTEQLPVPGVAFPDIAGGELVSWGIVEGTRIGYIYGWGWAWDAETEFEEAVRALMFDHETDGLIIDFRFNMGGDMFLSDPGLALLFDETVPTIDWATRCDPSLHLAMCGMNISDSYVIPGDPGSFYDRPIAVLVGPGAVSSGDQVALRLAFHAKARFFGKSTSTAFNAAALAHDDAEFRATFAFADAYLLSNPGEYLTHDPLPVDHPVWLQPSDVVEGIDTVVEAAVAWIEEFDRAPRHPSGRVTP